jgi:hypothetical protein
MKRKAAALENPKLNKVSKKDTEEKQQVVIHWLRQHYFLGSGGSTPKAKLFQEYLDMCRDESIEATSNSAFGKLVRTAFPGVQSSRKGPRGAAKHQYKNLLPLGERSGHHAAVGMAHVVDDEDYEEEEVEETSSFGSSSSPVSSPQQQHQQQQQCCESSPAHGHSDSSSNSPFYFSATSGPMPSSPFSSSGPASDDGEQQLMSSPTPALSSYAHSSQPSAWLPPIHVSHQQVAVVDINSSYEYHQHQIQCHYQHQDLPSDGTSSFDDIDAYGAEAAAAAEQGVWEGDDVEAFFTTASAFLLPPSMGGHHHHPREDVVLEEEFGLLGHHGGHAREEEAQLMWCSVGVEDILSANKGEEWIDNLLQGCN